MVLNRPQKPAMRALNYFAIYVIPFVAMLAGGYVLHLLAQQMDPGVTRAAVNATLGVAISAAVYFIIRNSSINLALAPMKIGDFSSFGWGLFLGLAISFGSGIGFGLANGHSLNFGNLSTNLHINVLANTFPALCEEFVFRGGIVETTVQLFGKTAGLAAGSAPFGILHVFGRLFGNPVTASQVLGISLAGLMLSLVYLKFGILGAFACHLTWNSLVSGWIKVYGLTDKAAISSLEGSWVTCIALALACTVLLCRWRTNSTTD